MAADAPARPVRSVHVPAPANDRAPRPRRRPVLAYACILVAAFGIRMVYAVGQLPYIQHPDEFGNYEVFHRMVVQRRLNPKFFNYPSLFFDIQAGVHQAYVTVGGLAGWLSSAARMQNPTLQTGGNGIMTQYGPFLTARVVNVCFGVGLVAAGMLLASWCTRRRAIVALAGVVLAFHPSLVRDSGWITVDTLAALTSTLAVAAAVLVARDARLRSYVAAGVMVGLAASAKYNAVFVGVALLTAHLVFARRAPNAWRNFALAVAAAIGAFLLTTPYAIFDAHAFWRDFSFEMHHYTTGHTGAEGGALGHNVTWLWRTTGPLAVLAFGGVFARKKYRRILLVPASYALAYVAVISAPRVRFERNLVPLLPTLLVLATIGVWALGERLVFATAERRAKGVIRPVVAGIAVAVLAWPIVLGLRGVSGVRSDERAAARDWISHRVAAGSSIAIEPYVPYLDPKRYQLTKYATTVMQRRAFERTRPDVVIVTTEGSGRYLSGTAARKDARANLAWLRASACERRRFGSGSPAVEVFKLRCTAPAP